MNWFAQYKESLVSLFDSLLLFLENPIEYKPMAEEIQKSVISETIEIEKRILQLKSEIKQLKKHLATPDVSSRSKSYSDKLKRKIDESYENIYNLRITRFIFFSIVDSIACKLLPLYYLRQQSQKEENGFISGKAGFDREFEIFTALLTEDRIFTIYNNITNFLRYMDITCVKVDFSDWHSFEVKISDSQKVKARRQLNAHKKIYEYLTTGKKNINGHMIHLIEMGDFGESYINEINDTINKAREKGWYLRNVEQGLSYLVIYDAKRFETEADPNQLQQNHILLSNSWVFHESSMPSPFFIKDSELLYEYYSKEFSIGIVLDLRVLRSLFEEFQFNVEFFPDQNYFATLTRKDNLTVSISNRISYILCNEFRSLRRFVGVIGSYFVEKWNTPQDLPENPYFLENN